MSKRVDVREKFLDLLRGLNKPTVTKTEILELCEENGLCIPYWYINEESNRASRGVYYVVGFTANKAVVAALAPDPVSVPVENVVPLPIAARVRINTVMTDLESDNLVPLKYANYVPFGHFSDVKEIIQTETFYPVLITGPSGNGKTMSVEQACAQLKRKFVCISMTPETDEGDLLGNYVLVDGNMVWRDGPVTVAARTGAVLCIDEIDYGGQNLACLQRVFEGKPFLLKKKNEIVYPQIGFTVFATANTKGKGSEDGRYMYTNILNEAFLERIIATLEQEWPSTSVEEKILTKELLSAGKPDADFAEKLVKWANVIRKTFDEGAVSEVISTRRLVHIAKTFGIFGDKMKAIKFCLNRFDADTKVSFLDLYTKVDAGVELNTPESVAGAGVVTALAAAPDF